MKKIKNAQIKSTSTMMVTYDDGSQEFVTSETISYVDNNDSVYTLTPFQKSESFVRGDLGSIFFVKNNSTFQRIEKNETIQSAVDIRQN